MKFSSCHLKKKYCRLGLRRKILLLVVVVVITTMILTWNQVSSHKKIEKTEEEIFMEVSYETEKSQIIAIEVCGGLTNQRIAIIQGIILAAKLNRTLVLPKLYKSFSDELPDMDFDLIYDFNHLKESLREIVNIEQNREVSYWTSHSFKVNNRRYTLSTILRKMKNSGAIRTDCTFNSINTIEDPSIIALYMKIDRSLQFQKRFHEAANLVVRNLPKEYIALHYRTEEDWVEHCKTWKGDNCNTNTEYIDRVIEIFNFKIKTIYIAGCTDLKANLGIQRLTASHTMVSKENILSHDFKYRDLNAIVDHIVCERSTVFIGNSVSTFSADLIFKRNLVGLTSRCYNGVDIPLRFYVPQPVAIQTDTKLSWVFAITLDVCHLVKGDCSGLGWNQDYVDMAKVAVLSAKAKTQLKMFGLVLAGDRLSVEQHEFLRWLSNEGVTLIRHTPEWATQIVNAFNKGLFQQNINYSPLYSSVASLLGTFLRIDIPILGFTDDFILYTDVDIIFIDEVNLNTFGTLPTTFLAGAEIPHIDKEYANAGIMLYNMKGMRTSYKEFLGFIFSDRSMNDGLHFGSFGPGDQGAYNKFYNISRTVHPYSSFNYRPYWKMHPLDGKAVAIVHFHGPKPKDYYNYLHKENLDTINSLFWGLLENCDPSDPRDICWKFMNMWMNFSHSI